MLVGYMRVSTSGDRQVFDPQRDALLAAGVDARHLFEDRVTGSRGERAGLTKAQTNRARVRAYRTLIRSRVGPSYPDSQFTIRLYNSSFTSALMGVTCRFVKNRTISRKAFRIR
jgi:hypothetical protein